jgi:NAD(P)-dependent dehydrogenase (short-subunit alcohol dehydrogenase family)
MPAVSLLEGEVALVTGATRGIGLAIAHELAAEGARVALGSRNAARARAAVEALGAGHLGVELDVSSRASVDAAVEEVVGRLGEPTVLVNNAGVNRIGPSESLPEEDWEHVLDVNLMGVARCCQAVGARMLERGQGVIVNVASVTGPFVGTPGRGPYAASKAGVIGLTRVLGIEWAPRGVRVVAVAPGPVKTPMLEQAIRDGIVVESEIVERTPAGRLAAPEDVARAVALLASSKAAFVTGSVLVVDGGYSTYGAAHPVSRRLQVES